MAKNKKPGTSRAAETRKTAREKQHDQRRELQGVLWLALGAFFLICLFVGEQALVPRLVVPLLLGLLGLFAYAAAVLMLAAGIILIFFPNTRLQAGKTTLTVLFLLCVLGCAHYFLSATAAQSSYGQALGIAYQEGTARNGFGLFAALYVYPLFQLLGKYGTPILFIAGALAASLVLFNLSLRKTGQKVAEKTVQFTGLARNTLHREPPPAFDDIIETEGTEKRKSSAQNRRITITDSSGDLQLLSETDFSSKHVPVPENEQNALKAQPLPVLTPPRENIARAYLLPPISLLKKPAAPRTGPRVDHSDNVRKLEGALRSFGVNAKVENICIGPAVSRYELTIEQGTRVNRILALADDIALAMAARGVRIEAPIPGKSAIGIEIPNTLITPVSLREVIDTPEFTESDSRVSMAVGKDIAGIPIIADISKMPHLLIAGQTGSGKSVAINSLIVSILYKSTPDEVRFILVDPKKVELSAYNGLPNLLLPVVTDPKKAAGALLYVVQEMEKRYTLFDEARVKDIARYNEVAAAKKGQPLYRIVVIVDELNDLMMVAPGEVEDSVMRIAQLARAAGIYLVLATQRPSVNVITGVIKANIPSRIAFAVASGHDSRTILDMGGAEKLVGRGDMLFHRSGDQKPMRVQGAYIDEGEVEAVVKFIKDNASTPEYIDESSIALMEEKGKRAEEPLEGEADELLEKAIETVLDNEQASISLLQRKMTIGYARAGRLIDTMEKMKIVGPSLGSKPRDILLNKEQYINLYRNKHE